MVQYIPIIGEVKESTLVDIMRSVSILFLLCESLYIYSNLTAY